MLISRETRYYTNSSKSELGFSYNVLHVLKIIKVRTNILHIRSYVIRIYAGTAVNDL